MKAGQGAPAGSYLQASDVSLPRLGTILQEQFHILQPGSPEFPITHGNAKEDRLESKCCKQNRCTPRADSNADKLGLHSIASEMRGLNHKPSAFLLLLRFTL